MNPTRREFAQTIGTLAAAAGGMIPPLPTTTEKPKPAEPQPKVSAAQAFTDVVRRRYPDHLTEDQLHEVQSSIAGILSAGDRLKQFKLKNSDEPAFVFSAEITE